MMKKVWIGLLALLWLGGCSTPHSQWREYRPSLAKRDESALLSKKILTLAECLEVAYKNHRSLHLAQGRIRIVQNRVYEAWTTIMPQLSFEGQVTSRNNQPGFEVAGQDFVTGKKSTGSGRINLLVPIYSFGRAGNELDLAHHRVDQARFDLAQVRLEIGQQVSLTYFSLLKAEKLEKVIDESVKVLKSQLEIARDFFAQGLVARSDVLSVEVQLARRRQDQIGNDHERKILKATLNRLLGRSVNEEIEVKDVEEIPSWSETFSQCFEIALRERPDLARLGTEIDMARSRFRRTRSDLFPKIYGFGNYNYSIDDRLLNQGWLEGGLALEWPLLNGGRTFFELNRREEEIEQSLDQYAEKVDDILLEIKEKFLNLKEKKKQIPVAKKSVELARENLRITRDRYQQGLADVVDLLRREEDLSQAKSGYYSALYSCHQSLVLLKSSLGLRENRP